MFNPERIIKINPPVSDLFGILEPSITDGLIWINLLAGVTARAVFLKG